MQLRQRQRPLHLGLTGGIGSGKSTVGAILAGLGAALIDADQISREVTGPSGPAVDAIRTVFGSEFVDARGALDRARMRSLVFAQPDAKAQLEAIVHPLVTLRTSMLAEAATRRRQPLIVFDIPLLAESGRWTRRLDAVLVVDCSAVTQIERVMRRSSLSREEVQNIIASQASRPARRAIADAVLDNDLCCTVEQLHTRTRQAASLFGL